MLQGRSMMRRAGTGAVLGMRSVTRPFPQGNLPPPPAAVYNGFHPEANATLLQQVWSGSGFYIAAGSRVKADFVGNGMYNVYAFIGQKTQVGPIHVSGSQLQLDEHSGAASTARGGMTAQQAFVTSQRLQATQATQAGGRVPPGGGRGSIVGKMRVSGTGSLPEEEENEMEKETLTGLGTAMELLNVGLGMPGPYGRVLKQVLPAGLYEISGTQVALHDPQMDPSTLAPAAGVIGYFNNKYGDNQGKVVGEPDAVMADGQTADANGYSWARVAVSGGELAGKAGYVAVQYLAPRGWTAQHGGVVSAPISQGGVPVDTKPPVAMIGSSDVMIPVLAVAGLFGLGLIGIAIAKKRKKGRGGKKSKRGAHRNVGGRRKKAHRRR